jgi:hypothetical protein
MGLEADALLRMLEAAITQAPVIGVLIWYVVTLRNENRELRELLFDLLLPETVKARQAAQQLARANGD